MGGNGLKPQHAAQSHNGALWLMPMWFVAYLCGETVFSLFAVGGFLRPYQVLFALVRAAATACFLSLLPKKAGAVVSYVFAGVAYLIYTVQIVYHHIFDSFFSVAQLGMGADAVTAFGKETLLGIVSCLLPIFLMLTLPGVVVAGTLWLRPYRRFAWQRSALTAVVTALLWGAVLLTLPLGGQAAYAPADLYHGTFVLNLSEKQFGPMTTLRLELRQMLFFAGALPVGGGAFSSVVKIVVCIHRGCRKWMIWGPG